MDGNLGFGTIAEHDVLLGSTETEGTVALGGNLTFGPGYNVMIHPTGTYHSPGETSPTALLVGGRILMGDSARDGVLRVENDGYVHVGDAAGVEALDSDRNGASVNTEIVESGAAYDSTPRVQLTTRENPGSVRLATLPINFTTLFAEYRQRARDIAACPQNVVLNDASGTALPEQTGFGAGTQAYVTLTPGVTNVLHLTGEDVDHLSELDFRTAPTADTPFVVVVDPADGAYTWNVPNLAGVSGAQAPYMLWDFPSATDITLAAGDTVEGTVYAPSAHLVDKDPSNTEGDIAVESYEAGPANASGGYENAGEIHNFPFNAELDCTSESTSTSPTTGSPTTTSTTPMPTSSTSTPTVSPSPSPSPSSPSAVPSPSMGTPGGGGGDHLAQTGIGQGRLVSFGLAGVAAVFGGAALTVGVYRRRRRHGA